MADEAAIGARERKLLFFLEQFSSARNSLVAPYWVTQAGIAERTGLSQPNVSTALRVLLARGLAAGRVGLVEGGPRTKTVYFLTEEGMNLAARLSEDTPTPVSHPPALPVARPVFGREREQRALSEWLRSGKTRVMYIQGLAGIGKTTLLLAFLERARTSTSLFYFPIHPWTTATQLFGELAEFLAALGRPGLRDLVGGALRHGAPLDFGAALFRTCEELRGLRALIALEDYHDASQAVRDVVSVLAAGDAGLAVNIIANGRGPASPFEARAVRAGQVELLKLGGLDREAVGEMLSQRASTGAGVPADLERIVRATGGNPLFVQLLPADADISRPSDLRAFLAQEIESRLPADEVGLLRALCVHRGPVPLEAFAAPGQVDLVGDLIARSLVEPGDSESRYGMHAMLREFFYHSLTRAEREVWHSAAATHYGTRLGESAAVERLWHLAAAGDPAKFATALLASGPDLLRSGHGVALLSAIMSCGSGPFDPQVRLMQARCHLAVGDLDGARVAFEAARGAAAEEGDRARALEGIAHCHSMSGEAPEAMRSCARGLRHASAIRDPTTRRSVRASLLKELGSARIVAGLHRKAIEALELARRAAETLDDDRLLAGCHNSLGMAYRGLGDFTVARRHFERSRAIVRLLGDLRLGALSLNNLGVAQWAEGDYAGATATMGEALLGAERAGDRLAAMYARLNLGIIAANRGSKGEALGYIERALAGAQEAGRPWDVAVARADLADVVLQCGDPARALAELEAAEAIRSPAGDPAHLAQWSLIGMRACLALGRLKEAEARYRRAREAARSARSPVTDALVAAAGAEVALRAGRLAEATRLARAAAGFHRRGLGDFREGANAFSILGEVLAAIGKRRGAVRALEEAAGRYERLGSKADAARCRTLIGRA